MDADTIGDSPLYLLGVCDQFNTPVVSAIGSPSTTYERLDIIGIRNIFYVPVFPFPGDYIRLLFLADNNSVKPGTAVSYKLSIKDSNGKQVGTVGLAGNTTLPEGKFATRFSIAPVDASNIHYKKPDEYSIYLLEDEKEILVGRFALIYQKALPLTEERIRALKTDPSVNKHATIILGCNKCTWKVKIAAALDRNKLSPDEIWYSDAPTEVTCNCGTSKVDLLYIRDNLHGLLGSPISPFSVERNYTHASLTNAAREFKQLIEQADTGEESLQKFIENHPILLSLFTPKLLKFKASATAHFKTDFALLNQKGELVLIEIEKASTPLFSKKGIQHSKLTQAIDQVESWLQRARKNKMGIVDDLGIAELKVDMVTAIKGVVIAGRTLKQYEPYIEKLHARSDILFFTYDDIYQYLIKIIVDINKL